MDQIKDFISTTAGKITMAVIALILLAGIITAVIVTGKTQDAMDIEKENIETVNHLEKKGSTGMKTAVETKKKEAEKKKSKKQIEMNRKIANQNKADNSYASMTGQAGASHSTPQMMNIDSNVYQNGSDIERPATVDEVSNFVKTDEYRRVINNYSSGTISIPSINLVLPIIEGTNNNHLWAGATTFRPDQNVLRGNYPLLSHNTGYSGMLFTDLGNVKKGDRIKVTSYATGKKVVVEYKTTYVGIKKATDTSLVKDTEDRQLTLITCDVPHTTPNRMVVIAKPL